MTRLSLVLFAVMLSAVRVASAQPHCQPRIQVMDSWVNPSAWSGASFGPGYFGPGYLFDYPGGSISTTIHSLSAHTVRLDASGQMRSNGAFLATTGGLVPYDAEAVAFSGFYWGNANQSWKASREFGPRADATLNLPLTPFDQFWAAASNALPAPVWVHWVLHVIVC